MTTLRRIQVHKIDVQTRVKEQLVAELAESIDRVGLLEPVRVTKDLACISGAHRVAAFKVLGRTHIPAWVTETTVFDRLDDVERCLLELASLDSNLVRRHLTVIERAELHKKRREVFVRLEVAKSAKKKGQSSHTKGARSSYVQEVAKQTGRSTRSVERDLRIGRITPEARKRIKASSLANKTLALEEIAKLPESMQLEAVEKALAPKHEPRLPSVLNITSQAMSHADKLLELLQQLPESGWGVAPGDVPALEVLEQRIGDSYEIISRLRLVARVGPKERAS